MLYLNLYRSKEKTKPEEAWYVKFKDIAIESGSRRRAMLQGIVNYLNKRGVDSCVVKSVNSDILVFAAKENIHRFLSRHDFSLKKAGEIPEKLLEKAWQNKIRVHLRNRGLLKTGPKYIRKNELRSSQWFKDSFNIQATMEEGSPAVHVDPGKRVIIPLSDEKIREAEKDEDDASVRVRVLPNWSSGILVGRSGFKARDKFYKLGRTPHRTPEYWRIKNQIDFVKPDDEMLKIQLDSDIFEYPESCVFVEYRRGMSLPSNLKKPPWKRIEESKDFVRRYLNGIEFLGASLSFYGPLSVGKLGYKIHRYPEQSDITVSLGAGVTVPIKEVARHLKKAGPYSGKTDGEFVVFFPEDEDTVKKGIEYITKQYEAYGFGKLRPFGTRGFINTGGFTEADYQAKILELRSEENPEDILALLVLPKKGPSVYFPSRKELFEDYYGEPLSPQAVKLRTLEKIVEGDRGKIPIAVNTASQCYIKLGGIGTATWVLEEPADKAIIGAENGTSCYAYYDISRRLSRKASASAYSAMTDSYGRYIATGSTPVGGESFTPTTFHEILVELLRKIAHFSKRYKGDKFKRLVFAKDGLIKDYESEMMREVIQNGVPDEGKEPLKKILRKSRMIPDELVIDIISVNKSPNKRVTYGRNGWYGNAFEGTAVSMDDDTGLLVSCPTSKNATAQPIEIKLHHHFCLGRETPRPNIAEVMEEYYRLTFLDWASLYKQGKYALPQKLTQNLGENISAINKVPRDMILI